MWWGPLSTHGRTHAFHTAKLPPGKDSLSIDSLSHTGYLTHLRGHALAIKEHTWTLYRRHTLKNLMLIFVKVYSYSRSTLVERIVK